MKCPTDNSEMATAVRHGVEIEFCPTCRGIWLQRGELNKIIEKATPPVVLPDPDPVDDPAEPTPREREHSHGRTYRGNKSPSPGKSRKTAIKPGKSSQEPGELVRKILAEIFDID